METDLTWLGLRSWRLGLWFVVGGLCGRWGSGGFR